MLTRSEVHYLHKHCGHKFSPRCSHVCPTAGFAARVLETGRPGLGEEGALLRALEASERNVWAPRDEEEDLPVED